MARTAKKESALTPEEKLAQALVPEEEQPYQVPENWRWTTVNCVSEVVTGGTPSKKHPEYYGDVFPFFKPSDLDAGRNVFDASEYLSEEGKQISRIIPAESSAVCCIGSIGKCGFLMREGTTNQQINSAIPKITPLYLYYYFLTESFENELWSKASATTISIVNKTKMEQCFFPLAPLAEQQRIVDRIESLFAKLDEAKEKAQAVVDGAKERKTSLLFQAFTGKLTEKWRTANAGHYAIDDWVEFEKFTVDQSECPTELPDSWKWIRMGAVGYTNIGLTYSPSDKSDDGIIVLRSSNIQNGKMDYEDIVRVNMSIPENKMCKKGDLLICARNGSKALVGKTAIVDADGMSYGAFMAIFRSIYNPYIYFFLSSPFFRDLIDKDVGTTTINQVTQAIIKNLPLPFAPIEEQKQIVRILSILLTKEDSTIEAATGAIERIDVMKKAILARAFRGELDTNDPADESAEELLKRVL